jgi:hypothetical protein
MADQAEHTYLLLTQEVSQKFAKLHQRLDKLKGPCLEPSAGGLDQQARIERLEFELDEGRYLLLKEKERNLELARLLCQNDEEDIE